MPNQDGIPNAKQSCFKALHGPVVSNISSQLPTRMSTSSY